MLYNYASGLLEFPLCQCECCPGEQCRTQLLVFSIDQCNETTCSFEQCYTMYPKKCGLRPGITNSSCNAVNVTSTKSSDVIHLPIHNTASSVVILPLVMITMTILLFFQRF